MQVFRTVVRNELLAHDHDFFEIALITSGYGVHRCQSGASELREGDLIVLRPGAWHEYLNCLELEVFNCCFESEAIDKYLEFAIRHPALNYLFWSGPLAPNNNGVLIGHLKEHSRNRCVQRLADLSTWLENNDHRASPAESAGLLLLALASLSTAIETEEATAPSVSTSSAVLQCRRALEDELTRDWSLTDIAAIAHVAPAYLVRLFKRDIGLSPISYLNRRRAERAASLLVRTTQPIGTIGDIVGWPDASYFSRCFKKCFEMSPKEYRMKFSHPELLPR
jgi:AraC family L-rhamnose operon transcriptional activator RhaR